MLIIIAVRTKLTIPNMTLDTILPLALKLAAVKNVCCSLSKYDLGADSSASHNVFVFLRNWMPLPVFTE